MAAAARPAQRSELPPKTAAPASPATAADHRDRRRPPSSRRQAGGTRQTATIRAATIEKVLVHASGANSRWSRPVRKKTGRKLTTVVVTAVKMAGVTSAAASSITSMRVGERGASAP